MNAEGIKYIADRRYCEDMRRNAERVHKESRSFQAERLTPNQSDDWHAQFIKEDAA